MKHPRGSVTVNAGGATLIENVRSYNGGLHDGNGNHPQPVYLGVGTNVDVKLGEPIDLFRCNGSRSSGRIIEYEFTPELVIGGTICTYASVR